MNNQTLDRAINVSNELTVLNDILNAAENQPNLKFEFERCFNDPPAMYTITNESTVYLILRLLKDRKVDLEREFETL